MVEQDFNGEFLPDKLPTWAQSARAEILRPVERVLTRTFVTLGGCWQYTGALGNGYGKVGVGSRTDGTDKTARSHRVVWEHFRGGPIPAGLVLDHLCRNRACQRPDHMRVVTRRENTLADGSQSPPKANVGKTHCRAGHAYDAKNTYKRPDGRGRECLACHQNRVERRKTALLEAGR